MKKSGVGLPRGGMYVIGFKCICGLQSGLRMEEREEDKEADGKDDDMSK